MIEINLVPENLKKKKAKPASPMLGVNIPPEAVIGLVGGVVVLLIITHVILLYMTCKRLAEKKVLDRQMEGLSPQKIESETVAKELRGLQGKKNAIEQMTKTQKILWAPKLNDISDSIPRGVWLNKVTLDHGILSIEGSSVAKLTDEMMSVSEFTSKLKEHSGFLSQLKSIELGSIQRRKIESLEIADFSITAKYQ